MGSGRGTQVGGGGQAESTGRIREASKAGVGGRGCWAPERFGRMLLVDSMGGLGEWGTLSLTPHDQGLFLAP